MSLHRIVLRVLALALLLPAAAFSQSFNAAISGTVLDPQGAIVPDAEVTLTAIGTDAVHKVKTGPDGLYSFPNLQRGAYELKVTAQGFRDYVQRGINVSLNESLRVDVTLALGSAVQTVEVTAEASPLNFETAEIKGAVKPEAIQALPLLVSGAVRSSAAFIILQPGVNTGGNANPFNARVNGGLQSGDEAVLDGVTMQQGLLNQSGMVSIYTDFPLSPESVEEISILTSNYEPRYGSTTSSVITATTKSGTNDLHGGAYWYHRNTALNARPFGTGDRPRDLEHDFGAYVGGPAKIPLFWSNRKKTYFFVNYEGFRFVGGVRKPVLSVPTMAMRDGDFSEWPYPIYDPDTNPRQQFMGCDPVNNPQPNVICATDPRLVNSIAHEWLQYVPSPNRSGVINNYEVPVPITEIAFANSNAWDVRADQYIGDKDHVAVTVRYRGTLPFEQSRLPREISTDSYREPNFSNIVRVNWDHTFRPNLLHNLNLGYLNLRTGGVNLSDCCVDAVPAISGVFSNAHQPQIRFEDYEGYGGASDFLSERPTWVANNLLTWVKGKHTFKFGGEYRNVAYPNREVSNASGTFNFSRLNTGVLGETSGNAIASFLLEHVSSANVDFRPLPTWRPEGHAWNAHFGDTWKATQKLSINYGVRWDVFTPTTEKDDNTSFLDFGPNPAAGNLPGRLVFAGSKWGSASAGVRHPEKTYYKAFAPRLGFAYSVSPKTVARAGYGVFFTQAFYPGWGGGIALDGFNGNFGVSSTEGGLTRAFLLSDGMPDNPNPPPFIDVTFRNGQSAPNYRPEDANRLSYSQQWNLTVEHQFTDLTHISVAYIGNKGTRLASKNVPLNVLDPSLLSMGPALLDQYAPGDTTLHGVPIPYDGWVSQMTGCPANVAQALSPYPQYCSGIYGANENAGNSSYHSFQLKGERRFSKGIWLLTSYTISKLLTSSENTQSEAMTWSGVLGVISPYERQRNKALSVDDVPQVLSVALVYELPFGKGKRWANSSGVADKVIGGWQVTSLFRASSGIPFFFRNSNCNIPGQFRVACIPAISGNAFAQDKGSFDPSQPLFNASAFEETGRLPGPDDTAGTADDVFYYGSGARVSNLRGFPYYNQDFGLVKNTRITEQVGIQIRAEFFNVWNWHSFNNAATGTWGTGAFNNDVASAAFGMWNGNVTAPRNIQIGVKVMF
jgi:hypothetical protein